MSVYLANVNEFGHLKGNKYNLYCISPATVIYCYKKEHRPTVTER